MRARPDFRLTRGSRLRAASIRAAAKPSSGQNYLAEELGAERSVPEAWAGDDSQSREPPNLAVLGGAGRGQYLGTFRGTTSHSYLKFCHGTFRMYAMGWLSLGFRGREM